MPRGPLAPSKRSSARGSKSGSILPFRGGADKSLHPYSARDLRDEGLNWGPSKDVPLLQGRIRDLQTREVDMVVVMQVMLIRRLPPCKRRPLRLWEFNPEGPRILQHFMGMTPLEMYKLFFGSQEAHPELTEDAGLSCNRPDTQVSSPLCGHTIHLFIVSGPPP